MWNELSQYTYAGEFDQDNEVRSRVTAVSVNKINTIARESRDIRRRDLPSASMSLHNEHQQTY